MVYSAIRVEVASSKSSPKQAAASSISLANSTRVKTTEDPIYWNGHDSGEGVSGFEDNPLIEADFKYLQDKLESH